MERFTERDDLGGSKLVLEPNKGTGEHNEPWCISTSSVKSITIRGAAVERLAGYEDTNLTPDEILAIDKLYQKLAGEVMLYRKIGTVVEYQDAMEKQKAKKPDIWGDGCDDEGNTIYDMYSCPNCWKDYEIDYEKHDFCPHCGQAIDWSDYDD